MVGSAQCSSVRVTTRAKINLTLDVLGRRPDGYHDIISVMQSLEFGDDLVISDCGPADSQVGLSIELAVTGHDVPADESNLALRAATLVMQELGINRTLRIELHKRLPVAAGLAGGSSDAAGVIVGLNTLFQLGLSGRDVEALGIKLGADVPFCIRCGTARAEGVGERLTQLPFLSDLWVVILVPRVAVSTAELYREYDRWPSSGLVHPDTGSVERAICEGDLAGVASSIGNVFYPIVSSRYPVVEQMVNFLLSEGAMGAMMSGSGPSVYGIVSSEAEAREVSSRAMSLFDRSFVTFSRASAGMLVETGFSRE